MIQNLHESRGAMIETSHLRCFVMVADELHFGRAAERLNMTQPPLSRQIQLLERALGCVLLYRNSRSVSLTEAGVNFLPEAQKILSLIDRAGSITRDVAGGRRGSAQCGFTASTSYEYLPRLIQHLRHSHAEIHVGLHEMVSRDQVRALQTGAIDIGLSRAAIEVAELQHRLLAREKLVVALPQDHRLAQQKKIRWRDLHGHDFLMYESRDARYFHDLVNSRLTLDNIRPNFVQHLTQIHAILSLIRAGVGIGVVPASARRLNLFGVAYRDLDDPRPLTAELMVVWSPDNHNPVVPQLINEAIACAGVWVQDMDGVEGADRV